MTIEPDVNLPSADSSFTSAAASASFSANATDSSSMTSSNSRGSSQTNLTIPDDSACESDDNTGEVTQQDRPTRPISARNTSESSPGTETRPSQRPSNVNDFLQTYYRSSLPNSLAAPIQVHHQPALGHMPPMDAWLVPGHQVEEFIQQHSQSHVHSITPYIPRSTSPLPMSHSEFPSITPNSTLPTLTQPLSNGNLMAGNPPRRRPQHRPQSHFGRSRRARRSDDPSDPLAHPELEHMRNILQDMANSREIPEEWWMSAGLTPTITLQQSNDNSGATSSNERERH